MSRIKRHPWAALAALALILRVAVAAVGELHPLFPDYYYTDATLTHARAVAALQEHRAGRPPLIHGTLGERLQTSVSLTVYRAFGARPFLLKLFNACLGALAVAAFAWASSRAFSSKAALTAGLILAVWPSHIFYTSQNLKEAPVGLLCYAALGAAFTAGFDPEASRRRAVALAFGAAASLLAAGFYRSYLVAGLGAALLAALALRAARPPRGHALLAAGALLAAAAFFPSLSRGLLASFSSGRSDAAPVLIPATQTVESAGLLRPTSPEGITRFRSVRQATDRQWAAANANRDIGTQIYPGAVFRTWPEVFAYLPKGAFTVLFMPLPGLYPLEGKPGRWAAAAENAALLLIACFAAAGIARGGITPERFGLLFFFATMTAGAALLEFDLGSAGRHKLLYLPMLFPFAAEEARRRLGWNAA